MRVVLQRVKTASVTVSHSVISAINQGLLVLVGIEDADTPDDIDWLCRKIAGLRIFDDAQGVMNLSVTDVGGQILVVSQFTLHAATKKGNRPSYIRASKPEISVPLYEQFVEVMRTVSGLDVKTGSFGAMMDVALINDGPVTIIIDSKQRDF